MTDTSAKLILITTSDISKEFINWLDQTFGDEWYIQNCRWVDQPSKSVKKLYVFKPTNRHEFEFIVRIKFPNMF